MELIAKARRWRKVLGGGMRQVGILAAAAKIALTDNVLKLNEDHQNAIYLANALSHIRDVSIDVTQVQTNMVFVKLENHIDIRKVAIELKQKGILITPNQHMRLVTHLDITPEDIDTFVEEFKGLLSKYYS